MLKEFFKKEAYIFNVLQIIKINQNQIFLLVINYIFID